MGILCWCILLKQSTLSKENDCVGVMQCVRRNPHKSKLTRET